MPNIPSCFHDSLLSSSCLRVLLGAQLMRSIKLCMELCDKGSGSSSTTQVRVICLHLLWMPLSLDKNTKEVKWLWVYVQNHWLYANFCLFAESQYLQSSDWKVKVSQQVMRILYLFLQCPHYSTLFIFFFSRILFYTASIFFWCKLLKMFLRINNRLQTVT